MSSKLLPQDYELVDVAKLSAHPDNPRKGNLVAIAQSVSINGFFGAVVAQKSTGHILAGNHRWEAAKAEGLSQVPVLWVDVDNKAALKILLVDNKLNDVATYDETTLARILIEAQAQNTLDGTGYSEIDVGEIFKSMADAMLGGDTEPVEDVEESGELVEVPAAATSRIGDKWVLGDHRLLCGDSTKIEDVQRLMGSERAQVVFTDPPYNVDYEGYTEEKLSIQNDKMSPEQFRSFLGATFQSYAAAVLPTASLYVCHPSSYQREFQDAMESAGFEIRCQIIWVKNTFAWGFGRYKFQHEPIFYAHRKGESDAWYGDKSQSTAWEEKKPAANRLHPTMKPVELVQRALVNSSRKGEVVLDLFGGSGSTLIASEAMGRRARLMELDPKYVDVIVRRWEQLTGKTAVLEMGGASFSQTAAERNAATAAAKSPKAA